MIDRYVEAQRVAAGQKPASPGNGSDMASELKLASENSLNIHNFQHGMKDARGSMLQGDFSSSLQHRDVYAEDYREGTSFG